MRKRLHGHTTGVVHQKVHTGPIRIGVMCGERWYRLSSWRNYPLVWNLKNTKGFGIGPILFWDGS